MGWRRDEVWFDVDVRWFREQPVVQGGAGLALRVPVFFGLARDALALDVPNGLTASRQRRAALRRRRHARRTRAAAFVVAPAAVLTLAGQRFVAGSQAARALHKDPPTLPSGSAPGTTPAPQQATRTKRARPAAAERPTIHWQQAVSHGLPYAGRLEAGTQLPLEGPDWVTWNPVEDSVPNRPRRLYGHERTIRTVVSVLAAFRAANPGAPRVVVGDISFRDGGPMEAHRSHQNGLDVDVYYPRRDGWLRAPRGTRQVDRRLAQDLLDRFVAAGARIVFVGYSTGLRGPREVVVPYPNHEDHMHVRFRPPRG